MTHNFWKMLKNRKKKLKVPKRKILTRKKIHMKKEVKMPDKKPRKNKQSLPPTMKEVKPEQPPLATSSITSPQEDRCSCGGMFQVFGYISTDKGQIGVFKCDNCGRAKR